MKGLTSYIKLVELAKRLVQFDKSLGFIQNGVDNNYPERIERVINNSATAKPAAKLFKKYVAGRGYGDDANRFLVDPSRDTNLFRFLNDFCMSYAYQNGVFVHVNYNAAFRITSARVIPFGHCRLGKKDDADWSGKILVSDKFSTGEVKKDDLVAIDQFNPMPEVIASQIANAGSIGKYRGQILFFNPDKFDYPLAHIDNVVNDADSEYQASVYKNTLLRRGFFGKTLVVTKPLEGSHVENIPEAERSAEHKHILKRRNDQRDELRETIETFIGADGAGDALHLEMAFEGDDISKEILFKNIESNIDDKLFEYTESSVKNNIRKAFANIPPGLLDAVDNSFFSQSGEQLEQMKIFFQEQTEDDRLLVNHQIERIMSRFQGFSAPEDGMMIEPLIEIEEQDADTDDTE